MHELETAPLVRFQGNITKADLLLSVEHDCSKALGEGDCKRDHDRSEDNEGQETLAEARPLGEWVQ